MVWLLPPFLALVFCAPAWASSTEKEYVTFQEGVKKIARGKTLPALPKPVQAKRLKIISARYGAKNRWLDITERLRKHIRGHRLNVVVSNRLAGASVIAFPKQLKVVYVLNGMRRSVRVREGDVLQIPPIPDPYDPLRIIETPEELVKLAQMCPAEVGFYGVSFTSGKIVDYRGERPACMGSIVKLFVLLEVMRQADEGELDLSESIVLERNRERETCSITAALDKMILDSDNPATGALARRVSYQRVNALAKELSLEGISETILPKPGVLKRVLTKRLDGPRAVTPTDLPPQHGTARGMVEYFRLLHDNRLINESISKHLLEVLERNPRYYASRATPQGYKSVGKGGTITAWERPTGPSYNMRGWAVYILNKNTNEALAFCLWLEWYPKKGSPEDRNEWAKGLSNCLVHILLRESARGRRLNSDL